MKAQLIRIIFPSLQVTDKSSVLTKRLNQLVSHGMAKQHNQQSEKSTIAVLPAAVKHFAENGFEALNLYFQIYVHLSLINAYCTNLFTDKPDQYQKNR